MRLEADEVNINGHKRTIVSVPYQHTLEEERLESVPAREFYNIKYRDLGSARSAGGSNLKKGMVAYAQYYGTAEQVDALEAMDANRIQWMYENGIIDTDEYFVYDDKNVSSRGGVIRHGHVQDSTIQRYIEYYDRMEERGRAEIRESRRKG